MQLIIDLPDRDQTLAFHRQRWDEICANPRWRDVPDRIETNVFGQIVMNPPPSVSHDRRGFRIGQLLEQQLGGAAMTTCAIITSDGVKATDAAWYSSERFERIRHQGAAEISPEICVEVLSPSNTTAEIKNKFRLYFEAGAIECWQCDLEGRMSYFRAGDVETPHEQSSVCPDFPSVIRD